MQLKKYSVGMMENNVYLLWDDESKNACLIDASGKESRIAEDAAKLGLDVQYIILTHGHFDHTDGLDFYKEAFPNAQLVAAKKEAKMLYDRKLSKGKGGIVADIQVVDGDTVMLGNEEIRFIETPGHSTGSMCILAGKNLFSGDTLFQASVGRTDFYGGSWEDLEASIHNKLFILPDDTRVLPGHMDETTIGFEKRYNPFV